MTTSRRQHVHSRSSSRVGRFVSAMDNHDANLFARARLFNARTRTIWRTLALTVRHLQRELQVRREVAVSISTQYFDRQSRRRKAQTSGFVWHNQSCALYVACFSAVAFCWREGGLRLCTEAVCKVVVTQERLPLPLSVQAGRTVENERHGSTSHCGGTATCARRCAPQ